MGAQFKQNSAWKVKVHQAYFSRTTCGIVTDSTPRVRSDDRSRLRVFAWPPSPPRLEPALPTGKPV